jgi:gamma-glutamylcyclotransferase (GGCT)/AIG2-like uncharacterized protein YtfP
MERIPEDAGDLSSAQVIGALLTVPSDVYADVMRDLDALEDFYGPGDARNLYEREIVTVSMDEQVGGINRTTRVEAWTYFTRMDAVMQRAELVPGGSWRDFLQSRGFEDAADDWAAKQAAVMPPAWTPPPPASEIRGQPSSQKPPY